MQMLRHRKIITQTLLRFALRADLDHGSPPRPRSRLVGCDEGAEIKNLHALVVTVRNRQQVFSLRNRQTDRPVELPGKLAC